MPDFLWQLVLQLRRRQIAIGVDDLDCLRQALGAGFGLSSREALRELLVALWAKSVEDQTVIRAQFEQLPMEGWDAAKAIAGPTDTVPETGLDAPDSAATPTHGATVASEPSVAPAVTRPVDAFPILPRRLGAAGVRYNLAPRYPLSERDVAQTWRRLRHPVRLGPPVELDAEETVRRRLDSGVATPPVERPRRRNAAKLLLLVDRQGSMTPFHGFVDHVVRAIRRQGTLAETAVWYFHDTPTEGAELAPLAHVRDSLVPVLDAVLHKIEPNEQGFVYRDPDLSNPVEVAEPLTTLGPDIGAALISDAGAARGRYDPVRLVECLAFVRAVRLRRSRVVWLNPVPVTRWPPSTAAQLARHVPMAPLDVTGMHRAVDVLRGRPVSLERPL
ncbi:hypothetical protein SAMN05660464_4471 [Geodermatophilus dictyosporus]|uniref:VWA domain containing CoxE-like protein n=1 Tax=Geodermatophilus dictyosporus TaxID=1523247 RepID=A0A1I5TR90_9ACTN|nr:VWA domain-containing protein [Geodermatophilus dictyosporus]SFP85592.1 hypothetical protein SAMN05660464_4471 [Geodermatophilus dictyosporus]